MRFFPIAAILLTVISGVFSVERRQTDSIANILDSLDTTISPLIQKLAYANSENATLETLTSVITGIDRAVNETIAQINQLQGQSASVLMASSDGSSLTTADIASILSAIVTLIFQAIGVVLQVVDTDIFPVVVALLTQLGTDVLDLLSAVISLVQGLATSLIPLLEPILSIVATLGLSSLLSSILGG